MSGNSMGGNMLSMCEKALGSSWAEIGLEYQQRVKAPRYHQVCPYLVLKMNVVTVLMQRLVSVSDLESQTLAPNPGLCLALSMGLRLP